MTTEQTEALNNALTLYSQRIKAAMGATSVDAWYSEQRHQRTGKPTKLALEAMERLANTYKFVEQLKAERAGLVKAFGLTEANS
jgi:hypothetical protein